MRMKLATVHLLTGESIAKIPTNVLLDTWLVIMINGCYLANPNPVRKFDIARTKNVLISHTQLDAKRLTVKSESSVQLVGKQGNTK